MDAVNIPVENVESLTERIEKLNRRAAKLGLSPLVLTFGEEFTEKWWQDSEGNRRDEKPLNAFGWSIRKVTYVPVTLTGTAPRVEGYSLLGVIDQTTGMIKDVPNGVGVPVAYRQHDGSCDHCNAHRNRKETYVLRSEAGETKVVGRNCLADFLRDANAAEGMVAFASFLSSAETELGSWGGSGRAVEMLDRDTLMVLAAKVIRMFGWTSKAQAEAFDRCSTATLVSLAMNPKSDDPDAIAIRAEETTDNDRELAKGAVGFAQQHGTSESNYLYNLYVLLNSTEVAPKNMAFAISAIAAYNRELVKKIERAAATNAFVGKIGDKLKGIAVTVKYVQYMDGTYGTTTLIGFRDEAGNDYKWFASGSKDIARDEKYTLWGTVKTHTEYKGQNATTLTRCKLEVRDEQAG